MSEANRDGRTARLRAAMAAGLIAKSRAAVVTSYDPKQYAAKVKIMPEGRETGWLPIASGWLGQGFGFFSAPKPDQQVLVTFLEGDPENGVIIGSIPSEDALPPQIDGEGPPAGDAWMVHASGGVLQFQTGGLVKLQAAIFAIEGLDGGDCAATLKGSLAVTGTIDATGNIVSSAEVRGDSDVKSGGVSLRNHRHSGVTTGGAQTGTPV